MERDLFVERGQQQFRFVARKYKQPVFTRPFIVRRRVLAKKRGN